jgi:hypothetical protein
MTDTFFMSILGILALMFGALILNVMLNLSRIAERHNQDQLSSFPDSKKFWIIFLLTFPLVFGLLYGGDYLTSRNKEKMLINSARSILENNSENAAHLISYSFNEAWISETENIVEILSKTDKNFLDVSVLAKDTIGKSEVFLSFDRNYYGSLADTILPQKKNFIQETSQEEREYLHRVFNKGSNEIRFNARDGNYELFYPYFKNKKVIVLRFSDYQRYGKIGS